MSKRHYIIPIFVPHEGCPHNCVFCNQESITGNEEVVDESYTRNVIENYLKTIDRDNSIIEVSFFGGTFTAIHIDKQKRLLKVAKEYKDKGYIDYIRLSTRPDYIDNIILNNLKKYGVDIIELGIQSMDKEVLEKSGRGHLEEDVYIASKLIKEYGFTLGHQIMLGLPGDTFLKDIKTTEEVISMKPDICRIYPALVVKNTPMEIMYNNGIYTPYSIKEALNICKIIYSMMIANGIQVIRVGLQPTEEINVGKDIVAGPFHPAFRELVESSILNDMIYEFVVEENLKDFYIQINSKDISKLYANKKEFFCDILGRLKTDKVKVIQNNGVNQGEIIIGTDKNCNCLSISSYILKKYKEGNFDIS